MGYLIGVDIGTQSTKAVLFDENGNELGSASREYDVITPKPSWAEQWPDVWVKAFFESVSELVEKTGIKSKDVLAMAVSGLYGGSGIPVDGNMNPLRPCIIWMDRRAVDETEWVKKNVPMEKIFSITGNYVDSYFGFTKIMWIRNKEPHIWEKTYKFVSPKDYIIYLLTGKLVTDHSSAGNLGGVYDLKNRKWSEEMGKILGIPIEKLPEEIVGSSEVVGKLKKDAAERLNLPEDLPIVAGGIDAPVAQLSAGVVEAGEHVVMLGTSMCWGTVHRGEYLTPLLVNYPYVVNEKELVYTFGGGATSGAIVRWFRDNLGWEELEAQRMTGVDAYDVLNLRAREVPPGSEGLVVLPYFMGERSPIWDPKARGVIFGLSLKHTKSHLYRAFLEGVAYSLRHNMEEAEKIGMKLEKKCYLVGGGSKSDLWTEILADVTGYTMVRLKGEAEAPRGDAFLAGLGIGLFDSPSDIKKWIEVRDEKESKRREVYEKLYEVYKSLYERTKDLMWRV